MTTKPLASERLLATSAQLLRRASCRPSTSPPCPTSAAEMLMLTDLRDGQDPYWRPMDCGCPAGGIIDEGHQELCSRR